MNKRPFGKTGVSVSEIGMGTYYDRWWIRSSKLGWARGGSKKIGALKAGLEGGMNLIDSAEAYASEKLVAKAIRGRKRDEVFVATKVWHANLHREPLIRALEKSLRRLETSYVDLYQLHFPSHHIPIQETMGAMEEMKEKGKIAAIGVSNFSLQQMIEANACLERSEIVSNQVNYSLVHRDIERELLPYCLENGIAILAYYPLGHGTLAQPREELRRLCEKHSKTPVQVALNWLVSRPNVFAIPRASTIRHVEEDLGASGWKLDDADLEDLDRVFPPPAEGTGVAEQGSK